MKTILQVPMSTDLKARALKVAKANGFSSLQEMIRVLLEKVGQDQLKLTVSFAPQVSDNAMMLSKKNDVSYEKMTRDFEKNTHVKLAESAPDFLKQLKHED